MKKDEARQALLDGRTVSMYMSGGVTYYFKYDKKQNGVKIHDGVCWNRAVVPIDDFFMYYDKTENQFRIIE